MKSIATAAMLGAAVLTYACNRTEPNEQGRNAPYAADDSAIGTTGQAGDTVSHGSDSDARNFAIQASKKGAAEVALGRLAQQKGSHADVKAFGAMMVRDHTAKGELLKQAVAPHGAQLNTELPDDAEELMQKLQRLSGAEFDREYMQAMVDGHQDMKAMIQGRIDDAKRMTTSKSGLEQAVDQWAQDTLPGVEQHLAKAQQINATLNNRRNETR